MTSKLHGVCHSKGGPLRLHLREGQCSDFTGAGGVRKDLPPAIMVMGDQGYDRNKIRFTGAGGVRKDLPPATMVMGDQGYDRNKIRKMLTQQGIPPCILPRRCRKKPVHYSKRLDRRRHKIETLFSRQKDWWRLVTRYDGCAHVFRSAILLAAFGLFW